MLYIGIVLLVIWYAIRYWLKRRSFYRRNAFGNQEFKSFERSVLTRAGESTMRFIANCCLIIGLICVVYYYTHDGHGPVVKSDAPVKKRSWVH
jgi:hypothetical protein